MSYFKVKDPAKRDFLVNDYLKLRRKVKSDLQSEKIGEQSLEESLARTFKPITDSQIALKDTFSKELQPIAQNTASTLQSIQGMKEPLQAISYPFATYPLVDSETQQVVDSKPQQVVTIGDIAQKYLKGAFSKNKPDTTFGIRTEDNKFYIGDKQARINNNDITIRDGDNEFTYFGTPGLWELIQSKNPDKNVYTDNDLDKYYQLLILTNDIYQNNDPTQNKPKSSSSNKWKKIIAPIWDEIKERKKISGKGVDANTVILPQDPEALIERLELLLASKQAGNTGVRNELVSICDELLRQGVISEGQYKNLNMLI